MKKLYYSTIPTVIIPVETYNRIVPLIMLLILFYHVNSNSKVNNAVPCVHVSLCLKRQGVGWIYAVIYYYNDLQIF